MNVKYPLIAAAVAAVMSAGAAMATPPAVSTAAAPNVSLVIAGSSAAKNAVSAAITNDLCGGSGNTLSLASSAPAGASGSGNFLAFSCVAPTSAPAKSNSAIGSLINGTNVFTIYYRTEGGSVVGALPIVSGKQIKRLNIAACTAAGVCTVSGVTSVDGLTDAWSGAVTPDTVQMGITDVEPGKLVAADFPTAYSSAAFGTASASQLANLGTNPLFQQVFGLFVNTSGTGIAAVNLTKESAANILTGNPNAGTGYTDWSEVPDALSGKPLGTAAPNLITVINREEGSGTRTSTNIFFNGTHCSSTSAIPDVGVANNFSTTDELNALEATPGSIGYASIDNFYGAGDNTKFPELVLATINNVTATNLNAANGSYDFWFEAKIVTNTANDTATENDVVSFLSSDAPALATAPQASDVNVIPGVVGNTPAFTSTGPTNNGKTGTAEVFVNPFTRNGNSCNVPAEAQF